MFIYQNKRTGKKYNRSTKGNHGDPDTNERLELLEEIVDKPEVKQPEVKQPAPAPQAAPELKPAPKKKSTKKGK